MSEEIREQINKVKNFGKSLNESEKKEEYVIIDKSSEQTRYGKLPYYDVGSNSFFSLLPFATFFKSLERANVVLKKVQKLYPNKDLIIKNVNDVRSSENIKEDFNPMVGIDNFLNNPAMIALATAWLLMGKYKVDNLKSWKNDFLDYCNLMGYQIDKEVLDLKFNQLINKVKKIIKM